MTTFDPNTPAFQNALADLRPVLDQLPAERLETIRLDIGDAVCFTLGVAPRVKAYQEAARAQFGDAAAAAFDQLAPAVRAWGRAHADHLLTLHGPGLDDMVAAMSEKRGVLLLEAQALVHKKRMPGSLLAELVGGNGYRAMAFDVLQIVGAFRTDWAGVEAHTTVTSLELDQAEALAHAFLTTLGENGQADSSATPSAELRRRAYTYFVQTYSQVRRSITFLRWEAGDADEIAPSLFAGRTRKREEPHDAAPPTPTPAVAPGMPGGSPFITP